jgi:2'-5' RNA ligase
MRLLAAIRPPWNVVAHLEAAMRPEWIRTNELGWTYPAHWRVHLAGFGDVVKGDVPQLCDVVAEHVAELPPPRLRLSGVHADSASLAEGIWVGLEGDLSIVASLADAIPGWVRAFGFVLDRRAYRPRIQLARIGHWTTMEYFDAIVERLGSYEGRPWVADSVTLGHEIPALPDVDAGFTVVYRAHFTRASRNDSA